MATFQTFTAGQVLTAAQMNTLQANSTKIAIFVDERANGQNAGTSTNTYSTRNLTTTRINNIAGCSLSSNIVTLGAGTYYIEASAPAFNSNGHKIRIRNVTDSTTIAIGSSSYNSAGGNNQTESKAYGYVTLTGNKDISIEHVVNNAVATNGFGAGGAVGGDAEVFAQLFILQIA